MPTWLFTTSWAVLLSWGAVSSTGESVRPRRQLRSSRDVVNKASLIPLNDAVDDLEAMDDRRHLQLTVNQKLKQPRVNQRDRTKLFLTRTVIRCDPLIDLESCWREISLTGENLVLKHQLLGLHALALETDESTIEDLSRRGFNLTDDKERSTLAVEDSLQYHDHRSLKSGQQIGYGVDLIRATEVWSQYQVRGEGVKVCIMDTGVYSQHPDFEYTHLNGWNSTSNFVVPWNEDLIGHGTHITGTLAASDNSIGYIGVAPGVDIYLIRVYNDEGKFYGSDVVAAAEACRDSGANIISMSLGGQGFDQGEYDIFKTLYYNYGIIAVASSGNTGGPELIYPASYTNVVSVTAGDQKKRIPNFATFNSFVDIAAPGKSMKLDGRLKGFAPSFRHFSSKGVDIPSTYIGKNSSAAYASLSGTSMAVPHVVGTLALMKSYAPKATPDELLYALKHSTQSMASNLDVGMVDALAAVQMLKAGVNLTSRSTAPCLKAEMTLETDQWGQDLAYRLRRISDNIVLWKGIGLESENNYLESSCVDPKECYEFIIRDTLGDGLVAPGHIKLTYAGQIELDYGGFGSGGKILFGGGC